MKLFTKGLWWYIIEREERFGDYKRAYSYLKKLNSKKLIHSSYAYFKLEEKYGSNVAKSTFNKYKENHSFSDSRYLKELLKLCIARHYGIYRYISMLKAKHINEGYNLYTYSLERDVMNELLFSLYEKYKNLPYDKRMAKIKYKLLYNGFSKLNMEKIL